MKNVEGPPIHSETIAQWTYTPEEWRRFGLYEGRHLRKLLRQTKTAFFVILGIAILALLAIPVFGVLKWTPWDRGMILAAMLILIFGGGLLAVAGLVWSIQRSKLNTLTAQTGEVVLTLTSISISGIWHRWNYEDMLGHRFHDASTMTVNEGKPDQMDLLEVRTIAYTQGPNSARDVISSCRVPIPNGRRPQADEIVARIRQEKDRRETSVK